MNKLIAKIILALILSLGIFRVGKSCTAFFYNTTDTKLLGKNLDWDIDMGYVFYNQADIFKSTFYKENRLRWVSKYYSITFNQFGKNFPLGGMNEKALVIEELNAVPVELKRDTNKLLINEFQIVQYILDVCSTVYEAEARLKTLQLNPDIISLHYLIADSTGTSAVIEFNGHSFEFYYRQNKSHQVLSNNNYHESLQYLKHFQGFGGNLPIIKRQGSNERFVYLNSLLYNCDFINKEFAFNCLNEVKQPDTKWSIVYSLKNKSISFIFHDCKKTKQFKIADITCKKSNMGCKLTDCNCNESSFHEITSDEYSGYMKELKTKTQNLKMADIKISLFENHSINHFK